MEALAPSRRARLAGQVFEALWQAATTMREQRGDADADFGAHGDNGDLLFARPECESLLELRPPLPGGPQVWSSVNARRAIARRNSAEPFLFVFEIVRVAVTATVLSKLTHSLPSALQPLRDRLSPEGGHK